MIKKIFLGLLIFFSLIFSFDFACATTNIETDTKESGTDRTSDSDAFNKMNEKQEFFGSDETGEQGVENFLLNIARDLRVIVFGIVMIFGIVMVIKLIFTNNTEEEQKKLKMGILWCTIGIIVMQTAFAIYDVMFDKPPDPKLARDFATELLQPFVEMLMFLASFIFIAIGIYAFYIIVTGAGEEEKTKKGKMAIINAIIGFIVIKFAKILIENTFNPSCGGTGFLSLTGGGTCNDITGNAQIIFKLIKWFNGFVAIAVIIMIVYAGFLVMTGGGEEDKNKKAKNIMLFAAIGVLILFASYTIMTFFILPNQPI